MKSLSRYPVPLCAAALTIGIVAGAAMLEYAHVGIQMAPTICRAETGVIEESPFLREIGPAMTKMMDAMTVKPTGDVDADFVAMMVPHHRGAIEMAQAVLRYGRNPQIKRLSQEIIVTQQQEIVVMRLAVREPMLPSTASPTQQPLARIVSDVR
jgi:uncharacterized protein (DUF305 family)